MIGFRSRPSGARGSARAAYVSPSASSAPMFSDNSPDTLGGSLNTLFVAILVNLSGGGVRSGPVALDHVIKQRQAGTSRRRIFSSPSTSPRHHQRGSVGRERSANKSTRRGVEVGNIRFVKVNGAAAARKPQVLRKSEF